MNAVQSLCKRAIQIEDGKVVFDSSPEKTIGKLLRGNKSISVNNSKLNISNQNQFTNKKVKFIDIVVTPQKTNFNNRLRIQNRN